MAEIFFQGIPVHTAGELPPVGSKAPEFSLTAGNLGEIKLSDYAGKNVILNIFPSIDTGVCAASVRRFNKEANALPNTVVLCVSMDLPFAASRFCAAEGLENVVTASAFRSPEFAKGYGVEMIDGPLKGLLARAVVVIDGKGDVVYEQLVEQITDEPDYKDALAAVK